MAMAGVNGRTDVAGQLELDPQWAHAPEPAERTSKRRLCARCQAREARYGFRPPYPQPPRERPSTLCFECFRLELERRHSAARYSARTQSEPLHIPLEERLRQLTLRRRRAQIAARRAVGE